ncbi:MAG: hypothetical protein Q8K99_03680 [Actinomycetota bacterium]|nr:hypothetical protein [Actinomycetota bacterium]
MGLRVPGGPARRATDLPMQTRNVAYVRQGQGQLVTTTDRPTRAWLRRATTLVLAGMALSLALTVSPPSASAITRSKVVSRAKVWVKKNVQYSQRGYYRGYRRDCSGFVSMAWKLDKSYTTRTIHTRGKRISTKRLKPGDAVLTPGHVVIFEKWKNKKKGTFYALHEMNARRDAERSVRKITKSSKAYRRKGIKNSPRVRR